MPPKTNYDVFLSHSHADASIVEELAVKLTDEAKMKVWLDKWVLVPGQKWQHDMAKGISQAKACAICIGSQTPRGWFQEEIERALNQQVQNSSFGVIPVLLPGADPGFVDDFLELYTWIDFRHGLDDAEAFRRLISGIQGKSPGRSEHTAPGSNKTIAPFEEGKFFHYTQVWSVAFSPDGKHLASASEEGICLWDLELKIKGEVLQKDEFFMDSWNVEGDYIAYNPNNLEIAYSKGWKIFLGGLQITKRQGWDIGIGRAVGVKRLCFSLDGKFLVSSWVDGTTLLWDVNGKRESSLQTEGPVDFDISPNNRYLAVVTNNKTISYFSAETTNSLGDLLSEGKGINCVRFSPDNRLLAYTTGWSVILWDISEKKERIKFAGHEATVKKIAFSPDGTLLASASIDKTVRLWDLRSGKEIGKPLLHEGIVYSVAFSKDGKYLASACQDKYVRLWSLYR